MILAVILKENALKFLIPSTCSNVIARTRAYAYPIPSHHVLKEEGEEGKRGGPPRVIFTALLYGWLCERRVKRSRGKGGRGRDGRGGTGVS